MQYDILKYKQTRTVPEEVRFRELEKLVTECAESDSVTNPTHYDTALHQELCSKIATRFFKDLALYGPDIANDVQNIVANILRVTGKLK